MKEYIYYKISFFVAPLQIQKTNLLSKLPDDSHRFFFIGNSSDS